MNIRSDIRADIIHAQTYTKYYSNGDDGDGVKLETNGTPYEVATTISLETTVTSLTAVGAIDYIYLIALSGSISVSLDGTSYPIVLTSGEAISFQNLAGEIYLDGSGQVYFVVYIIAGD